MNNISIHKKYMSKCIRLAKKGKGNTFPNPLVGCVIVKNDRIIGEGYHKKFGDAHAEVNAINNAVEDVKDADLYVNLEPCSHFGKTPPCVDLIIKKKIKNVFIGMTDPNPLVSGRGIEKLKKRKINVMTGILEDKCKELNEVFIKLITRKKSFVTLKIASTLDGKIAEPNGYSKWITSEKSRQFVHKIREESDAILIGLNTLKVDNPMLNVRKKGKVIKEPYKIIVTQSLDFDLKFNIFKNKEKVVIITSEKNKNKETYGLKTIYLPEDNNGLIDLTGLTEELYKLNLYNILAEGGTFLSFYLLKYRIVDKIMFFYANKILGGNDSITMIGGKDYFPLMNPFKVLLKNIRKIDTDFLIEGYPYYSGGDIEE